MKKIIFTENFTTVSYKHFLESLKFLTYNLYSLKKGDSILILESYLLDYLLLRESKIISFYNARSALFHALKISKIKKGDEVIINGYNCISVVNSIIQAKANPIYCDIDKDNFGLNINDLKSKITKKTKVIIIQHTFGKTANINEILNIAHDNNILIIEDCCHSLGSEINGKKHGSFGDFSVFSAGRDKVISGVNTGFLIINNKEYFKKINYTIKKLTLPKTKLIIKNHLYNIIGYIAYKSYNLLYFGKIIMYISKKLGLFNEILSAKEKKCNNKKLNYLLPNSLAKLALNDFGNIEKYITNRRILFEFYYEEIKSKFLYIPFFEDKNELNNSFRVPLLCKDKKIKDELFLYLKKNGFLLGNSWSDLNIAPKDSSLKNAKYKKCKISEDIASRILFLPNHKFIKIDEAKYIADLINNFKK